MTKRKASENARERTEPLKERDERSSRMFKSMMSMEPEDWPTAMTVREKAMLVIGAEVVWTRRSWADGTE